MTLLAADYSYYRGFAANTQRTRHFVSSTAAVKTKSLDKTMRIQFNLAKIVTWFCIEFGIGFDEIFRFKQPIFLECLSLS
ncbi:hypothetical protein [Grimontia indica]|uniref:hypothetical protein n=1 Tax=Grimontia indica TaxID=1056512 RepID=UPI000A0468C8|nr:hypothetical protein [Grimontia indica]